VSARTDGEAIRENARAARMRLLRNDYTPTPAEQPAVVANIHPLSHFEPEPVSWLWQHRIPFGKITILEGPPDVGKSHLTLELAAVVTVGGTLPDGRKAERGNVVLVTCEDGLADTVRPRFDEAGGDPDALHVLSGFNLNGGGERLPVIPDDVPFIRAEVERVGACLLIIDPLTAYLGEKVNAHRDHDVRRALAPLQRMAEETGCAVLVVRHLRKGATGDAISAGGGSIGFTGLARCVMLAAKDPEDETRRVLAWTKNNLAERQQSMSYRLVSDGEEWAHVEWTGVSRYNANELLEAGRPDEERSKTDDAVGWLREYLSDGPVGAAEAKRAGRENGFSERTIERARERLGAHVKRSGFGKGSKVEWHLPYTGIRTPTPNNNRVGEYGGERAPNPLNDNAPTYSPEGLASMDGGSAGEHGGEYAGSTLTPDEIVAGIARENATRRGSEPAA
jgi:hypothetical protein